MKILLINPPITSNVSYQSMSEPLGLAYIAASIEQKHQVEIFDCFAEGADIIQQLNGFNRRGLPEKDIIKKIKDFQPDVAGITCTFTMFYKDSLRIAELVKEVLPECHVVLGGAHASLEFQDIISNPFVDFVVKGEGEFTFPELIDQATGENNFSAVSGIVWKKNNDIEINPGRNLVKNLDEIPLPARNKLNIPLYKKFSKKYSPFNKKYPALSMMTSRGCPYNCIFCSTKVMWTRNWRAHSKERVLEEMDILIKKYGAREIMIFDDSFIVNKKRVKEICEEIIKRKYDISLSMPQGTNIWQYDPELFKLMKKAGLYRLTFPIESGSNNTLKFIRKPVDLDEARKTIAACKKVGIWTHGLFILGFPYEKKADIQETINYAKTCGLDYATFYIAQPLPGSEMYDIYKKEGLLTKNDNEVSTLFNTRFGSLNFNAEELTALRLRAVKEFFIRKFLYLLNPINSLKEITYKLRSFNDLVYILRLLRNIFLLPTR